MSPSLIQGYVSAAMKISRLAVGDRDDGPFADRPISPPPALAQDRHIEGLPLGTRGGMLVQHTFPLDAEYEFALRRPCGRRCRGAGVDIDDSTAQQSGRCENPRSFRLKVSAGPHTIGLSLPDRQRGAGIDEIYSDFRVGQHIHSRRRRARASPSRDRSTRPASAIHRAAGRSSPAGRKSTADEATCARSILTTMARRAYRGPVSTAEIRHVDGLLQEGTRGRRLRIRHTGGAGPHARGAAFRLSRRRRARDDRVRRSRIASATSSSRRGCRSSCGAASRTRNCSTSRSRDGCAIRRCSISRSSACWRTRRRTRSSRTSPANGSTCVSCDHVQTEARNFDENLRQSFRRETEMLFRTIVRDDRSLIDLIDADYTFVDERLARHYGIPNIQGSYFRRVPLSGRQPAPGTARTRQHADGDLDRHAHIAGLARQVGAGESARHAGAGATARRRDESRRRGSREDQHTAAAARSASRQPGVRVVPPHHGPDGVCARELRSRSESGANTTGQRRSTPPDSLPMALR